MVAEVEVRGLAENTTDGETKNINKFIIRALVEAGSHGRDLSNGDIPKYPRIKRTYKAPLALAGQQPALSSPHP